jgi:hypothetical protein
VSSNPPLPFVVEPGKARKISLHVGDDLETAAKDGLIAQSELSITFTGPTENEAVRCRLNGETLTAKRFVTLNADKSEYQSTYPVEAPRLKMGQNTIEMLLGSAAPGPVQFHDVKLSVKYSDKKESKK